MAMRFSGGTRLGLMLVLALGLLAGPAAAGEEIDVERIRDAIERRGLDWTAGETRLTRMNPAERARYALQPGRVPAWVLRWGRTPRRSPPPPPRGPLPPRIDWRDRLGHDFVTPIRDQGDCGSCWAFATIACLESLMAWRDSAADPELDLSEQHLFDCAAASLGCDSGGVTWYTTGSFLSQTGVTDEACYPYTSGETGTKGDCQAVDSMSAECQQAVIQVDDLVEIQSTAPGWPWWDPPEYIMSQEAMDEIKAYLLDRPVGCSMRVYDDFYAYTGGVYEPTSDTGGGMHAVLIVGYDDEQQCWIAKNSWGADSGEDGFFRIRYNTSSFGMFAFVYSWAEDRAAPAFCPELPERIVLDQSTPYPWQALTVANCGGGVLQWRAETDRSWLELVDQNGGLATEGEAVAAGETLRVRCAERVAAGTSGALTLSGAGNGPVTIEVLVEGEPPEPDDGPPDAGTVDGGPADAGTADGSGADAAAGDDGGPPSDPGPADGGQPASDGSGEDDPAAPGGGSSGCGRPAGGGWGCGWLLALAGLCWARRRRVGHGIAIAGRGLFRP